MYTQCPECLTIYKVAAELIGQGHGSARCGHCAATFDVLRSLADSLPLESFEFGVRELMRLGTEVNVLGPAPLRALMARSARQIAAAHARRRSRQAR